MKIDIISIIAVTFITVGIGGGIYLSIFHPIKHQEAQAILCPVDDISTHAENIKEHLWNYKYDEARSEAQKLINLVDDLEEDKIKEDNSGFSMYN